MTKQEICSAYGPASDLEGADGFDLVAAIAIRYGVSFDEVLKEIEGSGVLARAARELTGIRPREEKPRGPPPDLERAWSILVFVENYRKRGEKEEVALRLWLEKTSPETATNKQAIRAVRKVYQRARDRWGVGDVPSTLQALFASHPAPGQNRSK